jgi:C-terminal binding protein
MKKKIILIDRLRSDQINIEKKILNKKYKIIALDTKKLEIVNSKLLAKVDGILAWHEVNYNKKILNLLKKCKIIVRVGVGFNNVDLNYAKKKGIIVSNVPDYGINDVADHTMAMLLSLARKLNLYSNQVREKMLWKWGNPNNLKRLQNFNLGILGLGRIGSAVALRAKSFGINVTFYDPYLKVGTDKIFKIKRIENLDNFLKNLDGLTIHAPSNKETYHMINDLFLKKTKRGLILINTARGDIIDKRSIFKFLINGRIQGLGLDVYEDEPPLKNDPLYDAWTKNTSLRDKIIFTPHNAFFNKESFKELREKAAYTIQKFFNKKIIQNQVN